MKWNKSGDKVPSREVVLNALRQGVLSIDFIKLDGSPRNLNGTLKQDLLPEAPKREEGFVPRPDNPEVVAVYEVDLKEWRSFRLDSLVSIESL